jgi:hypothetical protein
MRVCFSLMICGLLMARGQGEGGQKNPSSGYDIVFREMTKEAGMLEPLAGIMGHGGAWGDVDGDGLIDLYVGGFCDRPNKEYLPAAGPVHNYLFRNLGNGKFERGKQPLLEFYGRTSGAVFADLDNNGTLELYVANNGRLKGNPKLDEPQRSSQTRQVQLFRNDKGKFVDISKESGACPPTMRTARNIGVFDYNGDGLLDLFVVEDRFVSKPRSVLLRNKGNLQFEEVNSEVGLSDDIFGLGLAVADINADGRPDFFVPHSNRMFLSQPGNKYAEDKSLQELFAWKQVDGEEWPCGAAFGDLNNDGLLDLVLGLHYSKARNKVYLNEGIKGGVPRFKDVTSEVGLADVVPIKCPHVEIQDFDNDGLPDIYMSAGWLDDNGKILPLIYRNQGIKGGLPRFIAPKPIEGTMVYYPAGPSGDYDNDGRLDLFLINWFQGNHCRLLHNESPTRQWLDVQVVGKKMNRMGIGAQVKVYAAGSLGNDKSLVGFQEMTTGYGYASGQPTLCHFGLGDHKTVDVRVTLPGGKVLDHKGVAANRKMVVEEP